MGSYQCQICKKYAEDSIHALRECERVGYIWSYFLQIKYRVAFFSSDLKDWMLDNLNEEWGCKANHSWALIWGVTVLVCMEMEEFVYL